MPGMVAPPSAAPIWPEIWFTDGDGIVAGLGGMPPAISMPMSGGCPVAIGIMPWIALPAAPATWPIMSGGMPGIPPGAIGPAPMAPAAWACCIIMAADCISWLSVVWLSSQLVALSRGRFLATALGFLAYRNAVFCATSLSVRLAT